MSRDLIHVTVLTPYPDLQPKADLQLDPRVTAVTVEQAIPGGFVSATVGGLVPEPDPFGPPTYVQAYLPDPVEVADMDHVLIVFGGLPMFEGVVATVDLSSRAFTCQGYGPWAAQWGAIEQGGDAVVTSGVIARAAIGAVPWFRLGQVDDAGVRHAWSEMQYRTAADALQALSDEGGTSGVDTAPWMFAVYDDRLATFTAQIPPSVPPRWQVTYDPDRMQISLSYENRIDAVRVVYQDADGHDAVTPWFYRSGVDPASKYLRKRTLTGTATPTTAVALAQTTLAAQSDPAISGTVPFEDWSGIGIRAGDAVELQGYGVGFVTRVSHDLFAGTSSVQLGNPVRRSLSGLLQRLARLESAATAGRDPVTGAKE